MFLIRILAVTGAIAGAVAWSVRPAPVADEHMAHMSAADLAAPPAVGARQDDPKLPASNANAKARLEASPRHGEWVKIAWEPGSADSLMAWIVYPSTRQARSPVVVVVHENIGLTTWVRGVADQLAAEGFVAIAPDLISRVRGGPSTSELPPDSVRGIIAGVNPAERNKGVDAVARYAMSQPAAAQRYGVIGYCWGGGTVFMYSVHGGVNGYSGGVAYYGLPGQGYMAAGAPVADSMAKIRVPVMLLNGSKDTRITTAMPAIDSTMKALGKNYSAMNYEGAIHGFLRAQADSGARDPADGPANAAATRDAWPRTITFLRENLK